MIDGLQGIDPESEVGHEISSTLDALDNLCRGLNIFWNKINHQRHVRYLAQSGHTLVHCTCPLLGVKRSAKVKTKSVRPLFICYAAISGLHGEKVARSHALFGVINVKR